MHFTKLFRYVLTTSLKYHIDESHGLQHSMNTLFYANQIFLSELPKKPHIRPHERIIYTSAILHDMCDKKYLDQEQHLKHIDHHLDGMLMPHEIKATQDIISTMSYSYVKRHGFPNLHTYQDAYHIVREADLLTAYDFDRSMIYHFNTKPGTTFVDAYYAAADFCETRAFLHNQDHLFTTDYSKNKSLVLHEQTIQRMHFWKELLGI